MRVCERGNPVTRGFPFMFFRQIEHFNFEKVERVCKDLHATLCRKMVAGGLCPPLSDHFKR